MSETPRSFGGAVSMPFAVGLTILCGRNRKIVAES